MCSYCSVEVAIYLKATHTPPKGVTCCIRRNINPTGAGSALICRRYHVDNYINRRLI
jgi:hypothetical protein